MSDPTGPAPGWYPDPKMPGTQRFWDGNDWSEHVAPAAAPQPHHSTNSTLETVGILTALAIPLIGFVIGCVIANRDQKAGTLIILLSLGSGAFWFLALSGTFDSL